MSCRANKSQLCQVYVKLINSFFVTSATNKAQMTHPEGDFDLSSLFYAKYGDNLVLSTVHSVMYCTYPRILDLIIANPI